MGWRGEDGFCVELVSGKDGHSGHCPLRVWAISFNTLPRLPPAVPFPQRQENLKRGADGQPVKSHAPTVIGAAIQRPGQMSLSSQWRRLTESHLIFSKCWVGSVQLGSAVFFRVIWGDPRGGDE